MKSLSFLIAFILSALCVSAQEESFIYVNDIKNNVFHPYDGSPFRLMDFDNDGENDFFIAWSAYKFWHVICYAKGEHWQCYSRAYMNWNMKYGDTIPDHSSDYTSITGGWWMSEPSNPNYPTFDLSEGYRNDSVFIPIRKVVQEGYLYGWLRFSVDANLQPQNWYASGIVTLQEYSFCTIANQVVCVGQKGEYWTCVEPGGQYTCSVHPNPSQGLVSVRGGRIAEARLYSVMGQLVATKRGNGTEDLTMDITGLPSGLYFVAVISEDGQKAVKKIIKE